MIDLDGVPSLGTLTLTKDGVSKYKYLLPIGQTFPTNAFGTLYLTNLEGGQYGYPIDGVLSDDLRSIEWFLEPEFVNEVPSGSNFEAFVNVNGYDYKVKYGTVIRKEALYPSAPPRSSKYDGARYQYAFTTAGLLSDPAWRIITGRPTVYDNSARDLPNACSAGSISGGTLTLYGKAAIMWYAPLRTDAVRLTYNTIRSHKYSNGELFTVICSNYDMTKWVGFRHRQVWGIGSGGIGVGGWVADDLAIVVGDSPTTYVVKESVAGDTANNSYYTGEYNPISNTYTLWLNGSEVVSWVDETNVVPHGAGQRYVGFGFKGDILESGVQVSDWLIGDAP